MVLKENGENFVKIVIKKEVVKQKILDIKNVEVYIYFYV